jgi:tRNA modification GTPase
MAADTILAAASPPGPGSRAVLRLSGARALECIDRLCAGSAGLARARGFSAHAIEIEAGGLRLPAWALVFRAPRSFTGEDVVELHLPASAPLVDLVARCLVVEHGARWAGPGEFTRRAFENGRIDLSQAEAVGQLIAAVGEDEARAARRALEGRMGEEARAISTLVTEALAFIEAALDFPDEDLPEIAPAGLIERIDAAAARIEELRRSTRLRLSGPGVLHVVLAGLPNAGKSSLLNALAGRDAALVSPLAGTTRDPVRIRTRIEGSAVEWVDVAGSPVGSGGLERQLDESGRRAVERLGRIEIEHADLTVWVLDASEPLEASLEACASLPARRRIIAANKVDLLDAADKARLGAELGAAHQVSALTGEGLEGFTRAVLRVARRRGPEPLWGSPPRFLASAHQESALLGAAEAVERARRAVSAELGLECAAADLRDALGRLEELSGRVTASDVLGHVFARFCIGK